MNSTIKVSIISGPNFCKKGVLQLFQTVSHKLITSSPFYEPSLCSIFLLCFPFCAVFVILFESPLMWLDVLVMTDTGGATREDKWANLAVGSQPERISHPLYSSHLYIFSEKYGKYCPTNMEDILSVRWKILFSFKIWREDLPSSLFISPS